MWDSSSPMSELKKLLVTYRSPARVKIYMAKTDYTINFSLSVEM